MLQKKVYKILVGNKCDLENYRQVTFEQGEDFAIKNGMNFFETSTKENINVFEAFNTMTKDIINSAKRKKDKPSFKTYVKLRKKSLVKKCPFDNLQKFINY